MHLDGTMWDLCRIVSVAGVGCVLYGIMKVIGGK